MIEDGEEHGSKVSIVDSIRALEVEVRTEIVVIDEDEDIDEDENVEGGLGTLTREATHGNCVENDWFSRARIIVWYNIDPLRYPLGDSVGLTGALLLLLAVLVGVCKTGGRSPRRRTVTPVTNRIETAAAEHVETRRSGTKHGT